MGSCLMGSLNQPLQPLCAEKDLSSPSAFDFIVTRGTSCGRVMSPHILSLVFFSNWEPPFPFLFLFLACPNAAGRTDMSRLGESPSTPALSEQLYRHQVSLILPFFEKRYEPGCSLDCHPPPPPAKVNVHLSDRAIDYLIKYGLHILSITVIPPAQ